MEITAFDIYIVSVIGRVGEAAGYIAFMLFVVSLLAAGMLAHDWEDLDKDFARKAASVVKSVLCAALVLALMAVFVPSRKELAAMYVIPAVVGNPDVKAASSESLKALRVLSEKWAESLVKGN